MWLKNGGGCDRPRPSRVTANGAGVGLARTRGGTVLRAQIRCGIEVMQRCWGSEPLAHGECVGVILPTSDSLRPRNGEESPRQGQVLHDLVRA